MQSGWLKNSTLNHTRLWNEEGGGSYLTTGGGGYLHQFGGALNLINNLGCLPVVGVQRLLKHDLFENMFTMFKDKTSIQPYAAYWSALLFHQLVGTADVMETTVTGAPPTSFHAVRAVPGRRLSALSVFL